jgi:hypothetical protein
MDKPIELPTTAPVFRRQETGPYDYSDGPQMGSAGGGLARPPMLQRQLSGLVDQCIDIETEASDLPDIDIGFVMGTAATTGTSSTPVSSSRLVNVLMIGTGEYTTGYGGSSAQSDKAAGGRLSHGMATYVMRVVRYVSCLFASLALSCSCRLDNAGPPSPRSGGPPGTLRGERQEIP